MTTTVAGSGQVTLGERVVHRIGYGGMKLAGPRMTGPPADREAALAVLRRAVELGVDHIDTSGLYGPHVVNDLIREALHPYPEDLVIVTRVGARRTRRGAGTRRWVSTSCAGRWRRTWSTSASTRCTWPTCGCRDWASRRSAPSPSRSRRWPGCSRRGWSASWG